MNNGAHRTGRHKDTRVSVTPLQEAHGTLRRELGLKGSWRSAEGLQRLCGPGTSAQTWTWKEAEPRKGLSSGLKAQPCV